MDTIIAKLNSPYPFENSISKRILTALYIGLFVFLFLYIFQPFNINLIEKNILNLTLGYGIVTSSVMILFDVIVVKILKAVFNEQKWTVGKNILWMITIVLLITYGNLFYSDYIRLIRISFNNFLTFSLYTSVIGLFPIGFITIITQSRLNSKFIKESKSITDSISPNYSDETIIKFDSDNQNDNLELALSRILYIKSEANYVDVYYDDNDVIKTSMIRSSLKSIEDKNDAFFRCHRSFIVNMNKIFKVSGNAQGYKLHFNNTDTSIPVSRAKNCYIKSHF
ncbi:LytTR family DNA-binding domain-containing protein [Candidatus Kapabacteria bacterium]|nr:LytTR family DNA-binding domain-containing protein [Candidatus Kapabacteria bacterium]